MLQRTKLVAVAALVCSSFASARQTPPAPPVPPAPATPPAAPAAPTPPAPPPPVAAGTMVKQLQEEAKALAPTLTSDLAKAFVAATSALPPIEPKALFIQTEPRRVYSQADADALPEEVRSKLRERMMDEAYYYTTRYGTPLAYARPLDILASRSMPTVEGKRILDFGYGTIGHLRLLASLGAQTIGVEVDPMLEPLYSAPSDTGLIAHVNPAKSGTRSAAGSIRLITGKWPTEEETARAVTKAATVGGAEASSGLDLFISKNTLKNGYVHPDPVRGKDIDPRRLINLGVSDDEFVKQVHTLLKPGGLFMIYNICPAHAPDDKPYIPWADGRCPFSREILEKTGFEVIAYDANDDEAVRQMAHALGWDKGEEGQPGMDLEKDLFASWTLARRPTSK